MRKILAILVLIAGVEAPLVLLQGCKRSTPPPAQPAIRIPRVPPPDIPGSLPLDSGEFNLPKPHVSPKRAPRPAQPQPSDTQDAAAALATQQRRDARLLQQQQTASRQQQEELNREVKQDAAARDQMQDEPRIQDIPEPPGSSGFGPDAHRIQDAPGLDQGQPGQAPPRIQDAPGPSQTQPAQPPP